MAWSTGMGKDKQYLFPGNLNACAIAPEDGSILELVRQREKNVTHDNSRLVRRADFVNNGDAPFPLMTNSLRLSRFFGWLLVPTWIPLLAAQEKPAETERDIVIYGGTSAGLVAGFQALAMGRTVVVIEPSTRIGGLTTGGLGQTDIGNKMVIGGMSRQFYERIARYYQKKEAWKWQTRESYKGNGQSITEHGEPTQWTFEPSAALRVYEDWIAETGLEVITGQRLNRESGVIKEGARVLSIAMESGRVFRGKVFLDTTYEGDLMAAVGVKYRVGREGVKEFGENLNGVRTRQAKFHQFQRGVDPYVLPGDPKSGLLPFIDSSGPGEEGSGDRRVQAYCFRMCLTDHPDNRIPFAKPDGYNETWYELLFRNYEAGFSGMPWINSPMPNRKTDTNNRDAVSTDFIGQNYDYPEASYAERDTILARHLLWQQGLMWTLANHPRVPEKVRIEASRWGLSKDEFTEGGGWQEQLYIREARRMLGQTVMTQHYCQRRQMVHDAIGMGAYNMDSHNVQRHVDAEGHVRNEGDVEVGVPPYPIGYGAITPRRQECDNLLVPVCLSATHIAYGSIRMEPVFMILGQSAATAAALAIEAGSTVQSVPYETLQKRLIADGQVLAYDPPPKVGGGDASFVPLANLQGIVVDDTSAQLTGQWTTSILNSGIHQGYRHDSDTRDGLAKAVFTAKLPKPGSYTVEIAFVANANRAQNVPVTVTHAQGDTLAKVDQTQKPPVDGIFFPLGEFEFGTEGAVTITNEGTNGHVIIDAVRFLPK